MTYLKKVIIGCLVLFIPYALLLYFGQIPSLHPKRLLTKFTINNQTINIKWFGKSQTVNTSSLTRHNHVLFYKSSINQSRAANFKSSTNESKVLYLSSLTTKVKERIKYLIYHCTGGVCGGFGDRQSGIVSAFLLANLTGRKFGLILTKPCDIRLYLYPNEVQWDIPHNEYANLTKKNVNLLSRTAIRIVAKANISKLFKADAIFLKTNYILYDLIKRNKNYKTQLKWLSNLSYSQYFAESYRKLFKPSDLIARKLEEILKGPNITKDTKLICAHIRIGRNPAMPRDDIRNNRSCVKVVWDFLHRYNDTRLYKIFVATDSESVRKEAQQLFANQTVMEPKGKIFHVEQKSKPTLEVCQGVEKVLLDQYVLMHCDVLVHSRSYFGENAARLKKDNKGIYLFQNCVITPSDIKTRYGLHFLKTDKHFAINKT